MQETFKVPDVSCDHCKSAIEGALAPLDGVQSAQVDVPAKSVSVTFEPEAIDRAEVIDAIEDAGYPVAS